jgi:predicted DNA-binding transcriptional regulator YafY
MRADRLISIMMHLQRKGRMTARELAQLLEVSERTIYRDIDALSAAGVPIYADAGHSGGFSLPRDYRTQVDGLTTPEIHALFLQMNEQPFKQLGIGQSLNSALLKIFNTLTERHRVDAEWIQQRVFLDRDGWQRNREQVAFMQAVQQSVWEQRQAVIVYTDRLGRKAEGTLDSYGLVLKAGMWFVVGRAWEDTRAFRVARFESFRLTDRSFERPPQFRLESFWREWVEEYETRRFQYRTTVEAAAEALPRISAMHGIVAVTQAAAGRKGWKRAHISFENQSAALSAILAQGDQALVVAPKELRDGIREHAARLLNYYPKPAT